MNISEKKKIKLASNAYFVIGAILICIGTAAIILARYPQVWYSLNINSPENEFVTLTQQLEEDKREYREKIAQEDKSEGMEEEKEDKEEKVKLPPLDFSLPSRNHILIDKIGVDARIYEGEDYESLLEKGVWKVYDFGTPEDEHVMILSSHRFGYFTWTQEQRERQSFFHLPSTRVGDKIEIIWNQRKYEYEIYKIEEGERIGDYGADLILYTCKLYNSPIRIFRYAHRVN